MNVYKIILLVLLSWTMLANVAKAANPAAKVTPSVAVASLVMTGLLAFLVVMA